MRCFVFASALAVIAGTSGVVLGHGYNLSLVGSAPNQQITTNSPTFAGSIVGASPFQYFESDHGGFEGMNTGNGFPTGSALTVDFLGKLWYSNGGPAVPAPAGIKLVATGLSNVEINGMSGLQTGFAIGGVDAHEVLWSLQSNDPIPAGVYGIGMILRGSSPGGPFLSSLPLVSAFNTNPTFVSTGGSPTTSAQTLASARQAVFAAAAVVPEPAAMTLLGFGVAALAIVRRRLRRR